MNPMSPKTILIVEDEMDINLMVTDLLTFAAYRVWSAPNGAEALRELQQGLPDLILLDMKMPVMDGWEFARRFHETYGRGAPIVVLTAAADAESRALEIDADGFIGKPFDIDEFLDIVGRMVRRGSSAA